MSWRTGSLICVSNVKPEEKHQVLWKEMLCCGAQGMRAHVRADQRAASLCSINNSFESCEVRNHRLGCFTHQGFICWEPQLWFCVTEILTWKNNTAGEGKMSNLYINSYISIKKGQVVTIYCLRLSRTCVLTFCHEELPSKKLNRQLNLSWFISIPVVKIFM